MRNRTLILAVALLAVLLVGTGALYLYDSGRDDVIVEGTTVNGVELGGLSAGQARQKLESSILPTLQAPVVVRRGSERFRLSARRARVAVKVDAMVAEALARSRDGNALTRTWRRLTGEEAQASIPPQVTFSTRAVDRFIDKVRRETERRPRDATIQPDAAELEKVRSRDGLKLAARALRRDGLKLAARALRRDVERALASPGEDRTIRAEVRRIEPAVTTRELASKYPTYLTIDRSNFELRLYKDLKLIETYAIALGAAGRETPPGLYDIENKQVDPVWSVPNSDWAGALAGQQIPPGPSNPLKARWLGIVNGVGIHGTAERDSIGTNASKGCIRMLVEDVVELYPRVPVGTPVYIS